MLHLRKLLCRRVPTVAFALTVLLAGCGGRPLDRLVATPTPPVQESSARQILVPHRSASAATVATAKAAVAKRAAEVQLWVDTVTWDNTVAWNTAAGVFWPGTTGSVNGMVCGGPLPSCCTLTIESHGSPVAQNPISSASGLWQDLHDTWGGWAGFVEAKYAPAGTQNERNAQIYDWGRGWAAWKGDGCYPGG